MATEVNPPHYAQYPIEPIHFIMMNDLPFWAGNVVKYITRAGHKVYSGKTISESEILDLEKAKKYIDFRLEQLRSE